MCMGWRSSKSCREQALYPEYDGGIQSSGLGAAVPGAKYSERLSDAKLSRSLISQALTEVSAEIACVCDPSPLLP